MSCSAGFGLEPGSELGDVDDGPLVGAFADFLLAVESLDLEEEAAVFGAGELAAEGDAHAHGGGGEVADIDAGADGVVTVVEEGLHRIAGGHFEVGNHVGRAEDSGVGVAEEVDSVAVVDQDGGFVGGADGDGGHGDIIARGESEKSWGHDCSRF